MISKLIISVLILCSNYVFITNADEAFFKVPLEVRAKNRPVRIVDKSEDPDLRSLKVIQDQFFNIVGNASLNKEFKNFKQLLHLVDSEAGLELGRLVFRGLMIGYGKDNSNELLSEFFDDFQYRLSPNLADALMDYKDFIKTIDLKMIPLTIQTLFQKDGLGNSLAQMPLGQLVDLVQPEASKYGIDIKGVINGILGKGDATFPDMVKRALNSFNVSALLNSIPKSLGGTDINQLKDVADEIKRDKKDPALMLFKPFISNFLKENKIDLDTDAVIQVLTPFISPLLQSFLPSTPGKDGKAKKKLDFAQLLPMLSLLGSQLGNSNDSINQGATILKSVMSMMGGLGGGKDNDAMGNLLKMASGLLQTSTKNKKPKSNSKEAKVIESVSAKEATPEKIKDDSKANLLDPASAILHNSKTKLAKNGSALTPEALESVKSMISMLGNLDKNDEKSKDGKKGDSMANLLKLASGLLGNKKLSKDGSAQEPNLLDSLMPLLSMLGNLGGKDDKKDDPMANILNLASTMLGGKKTSKEGSDQEPDALDSLMPMLSMLGNLGGKDGKKDDSMANLLNLASSMLGGKKPSKEGSGSDQKPDVLDSLMPMLSMLGNLGGKDGKKDDSMANLLNLASSMLGGKKPLKEGSGSDQKPDILDSLMPMLSMLGNLGGKDGKKDDSMANLLNLASSMLGGKQASKEGSDQKSNVLDSLIPMLSMLGNLGGKDGKKDNSLENILNLASSFLGKTGKDGNPKLDSAALLGSVMSALGTAGGDDVKSMIEMVTGMMGTGKDGKNGKWKEAMKSHPRYKKAQENVAKVLEMTELETENTEPDPLSFTPALESFIVQEQSNKIFLIKIKDGFSVSKALIKIQFKNMNEFEKAAEDYLKKYNKNINIHDFLEPLRLPDEQFEGFISKLSKEEVLASPTIMETGKELAKTLTDNGLYKKMNNIWKQQMEPSLAQIGLQGLTLDSFPKRLGIFVPILVAQYNIPNSIRNLLEPLQYSIKDSVKWYFEKIEELKKLPNSELRDTYAESFYDQVIAPVKSIWHLRKLSKSSPVCLPRAVCDLVTGVPNSKFIELMVTRIGSIIYGGYVADEEQKYNLLLETIRASITSGSCEVTFPIQCPKPAVPKGDIEDAAKSNAEDAKAKLEHTEL